MAIWSQNTKKKKKKKKSKQNHDRFDHRHRYLGVNHLKQIEKGTLIHYHVCEIYISEYVHVIWSCIRTNSEVSHKWNWFKHPSSFSTDRSKAVPLLQFLCPCFVQVHFLVTIPRRFLCRSYFFARRHFHMWCLLFSFFFFIVCSSFLLLSVPLEGCVSWL